MSTSRFRWGIVGTGDIAHRFASQLAKTERGAVYGVASRSSERAARFASNHGAARSFGSYDELLADPAVDVVYLATPTRDHLAHCLMAIEQNKAVLCEKPLASSQEEGEQIVAAARARGVFCMEGMWMRFHPLVQQLRSMVRAGQLGDIHYVRAELGWAKSVERVEKPELGRGARLDFGVYPLSFVHYLLGVPERVEAFARKHPAGGDETVTVQLVYPSCAASIAASVSAELDNDALVVGSKAVARLGRPLLSPRWLEVTPRGASRKSPPLRALSRALLQPKLSPHVGFLREAEEVMRCLEDGKLESDANPLVDSLWVLSVADRIMS